MSKQAAGLGHFTIKIKQPPKSVSIASLVVKYKTDNLTLRVLNNSTSDFSLQCRAHVYVPGSQINPRHSPPCLFKLAAIADSMSVAADDMTNCH